MRRTPSDNTIRVLIATGTTIALTLTALALGTGRSQQAASDSAASAAAPQVEPAYDAIPFKTAPVVSAFQAADSVAADVARAATGGAHFVLHLERPLDDALRAQFSGAGIKFLDYLSHNAFFAVAPSGIDAAALAGVHARLAVHSVNNAWKVHSLLADQIAALPPTASSDDESTIDAQSSQSVPVYVMFHADVPAGTAGRAAAAAQSAKVIRQLQSVNALVMEIPLSKIMPLAANDGVMWIEAALPPLEEQNDSNRARVGANTLTASPYNLNGAGVAVLVYDGGQVRATHQDLAGRVTIGPTDTSAQSNHSTHVAGTIAGTGASTAGLRRGMAPAATIISYGFQQAVSNNGFLYTDPGDMEADYGAAINSFGADISNNSIGNNTAPNGYDCAREGDYGVTDTVIDSIVRGSLSSGTPFRIVWSNGNERQGTARCGATFHTTGPPACAKNHITVGALNSNDDSMTTFSSWGPADDGRMKPDVSGPGCEVGSDNGVTSCGNASDTATATLCGTSMSGPTVVGVAALLLQDFRASHPGAPDFRNSTLKVLLAHSAQDLGNPGPDNQFGYGSVRGVAAVDLMRTGNFLENSVSQGQLYQFLVMVGPTDTQLKVTLAWDDPAGTPLVSPALVNNLDLRVFDPSNTQLFPWTLDSINPGNPAVRTQADNVDNIEQVFLANPPPGVYRVEIAGTSVPVGPQAFSVVATPQLVNCSRQGVLLLDAAQYQCGASVQLRVIDCDLNTDNGVVETLALTVTSNTEPTGEVVTLTETAANTAAFIGTLPLSVTNGAGVLQVASGDTISVTYTDADDGLGGTNVPVTRTATADCDAPIISNVQITNVTAHGATITFDTNETARGTVRYGTACGSLSSSAAETNAVTAHSIVLSGLVDETPYFFAIDAADAAGNTATDDNGGQCLTFTTPVEPRIVPPFFDDFATTTFDPARWSYVENATIDTVGLAEPSAPNSARFNGNPDGGDEIQTFLLDLSGVTTARLSYYLQVRGGGESPDAGDDLFVEYLNASGTWVQLVRHLGSSPDTTTYAQQTIALPTGALHRNAKIRFRNLATVGAFDDWFVDDVRITGLKGDLNGDCVVNETDLGLLLAAWNSTAGGDVDHDGDTDEADLGAILAAWQAVCP
ncbi:MAG: S8 family serine peptidase [Phycisphaerae bacterium]